MLQLLPDGPTRRLPLLSAEPLWWWWQSSVLLNLVAAAFAGRTH